MAEIITADDGQKKPEPLPVVEAPNILLLRLAISISEATEISMRATSKRN